MEMENKEGNRITQVNLEKWVNKTECVLFTYLLTYFYLFVQ